jgi:hypothetical protein
LIDVEDAVAQLGDPTGGRGAGGGITKQLESTNGGLGEALKAAV